MLSFGVKHALCVRSTIFGVYQSFRANSFIKHIHKLRTAGKRFVELRSFIRLPKKHFYRLENLSDNHGQKSWDTFAFLWRFPLHTGPTPPLISQTMFQLCIEWGEEELQENFEKDALFLERTEK